MNPDTIPDALRDLPQWCLWRSTLRDGKLDKLPFQADDQMASSTNSETWTSFEEALNAFGYGAKKFSGLGFVFSPDDGLCGIDLDGCRTKDGTIQEWARHWLLQFDSYAEVSPSETGVKIYVKGVKPTWCGNKAPVQAEPVEGDKRPGVEIYDRGRYFAVTGRRLRNLPTEPQERQAVIDAFCEAHFERPKFERPTEIRDFGSEAAIVERARKYIAVMPQAVSQQGGHDQTFSVACVLAKGFGLSREHGLLLLSEWNQTHCTPPWNRRELEHKIDDALKAKGEVNYLRLAPQHTWNSIRLPQVELPREHRVTTLAQASLEYLERVKRGNAGLIDLGIPDLDHAIGGGVEAGELVILAALPSHGKSLVALQIIHHITANAMPAVMISEEMSALMLGKRTIQFATDVNQEYWMSHERDVMSQLVEHFGEREQCYIVEESGTADRAADAIREHVAKYGCKLAVVDYAQFLRGKGKDSYEQISNTSMTMKAVAKETGVVLLMLAQLNRAIQKRDKFIPQMSDLRGSGQLEQDADVIVFLCWPYKIKQDGNKQSLYQLWVAKNRNREINSFLVECNFQPRRQMLMPSAPKPAASQWTDLT